MKHTTAIIQSFISGRPQLQFIPASSCSGTISLFTNHYTVPIHLLSSQRKKSFHSTSNQISWKFHHHIEDKKRRINSFASREKSEKKGDLKWKKKKPSKTWTFLWLFIADEAAEQICNFEVVVLKKNAKMFCACKSSFLVSKAPFSFFFSSKLQHSRRFFFLAFACSSGVKTREEAMPWSTLWTGKLKTEWKRIRQKKRRRKESGEDSSLFYGWSQEECGRKYMLSLRILTWKQIFILKSFFLHQSWAW